MAITTATPKKITNSIRFFCKKIVSDQEPIYLNVTPTEFSEPLDCFVNVQKQIKLFGGNILYGWQIWEWLNNMLEAEFHAVWVTSEGSLVDITPKPANILNILFLPDPARKYDGRQVNNIRMPLRDDPFIKEFIEVNNKIFEYLNSKELIDYYGPVQIPKNLLQKKNYLLQKISNRKLGPNEPCSCGSGKKYKNCCLQNDLTRI